MKFQLKILLFLSLSIAILIGTIIGIISYKLSYATDQYLNLFSSQTAANTKFLLDNYLETLGSSESELNNKISEIEQSIIQKQLDKPELKMIQKIVSNIEVVGSGYISVYISNTMVIASKKDVYNGMRIEETTKSPELIEGVTEKKQIIFKRVSKTLQDTVVSSVFPYNPLGLNTTWTIGVNIPSSIIVKEFHSTRMFVFILGFVAILLLILGLFLLSNKVAQIGRDIYHFLMKVSRGDLNAKIQLRGKGKIYDFLFSLDSFLEQIKQVILRIKNTSLELNDLSNHLVGISHDANVGSLQQMEDTKNVSIKIHSTSNGLLNVSQKLTEQSANMNKLVEEASKVNLLIEKIDAKMVKTIDEAKRILKLSEQEMQSIQRTAEYVNRSHQSSVEIQKVLGLIISISKNINLLALNASIEANRAGDSGQGFMVVADEISKLAQQTSQSITSIKKYVMDNMDTIEQTKIEIEGNIESVQLIHENISNISSIIHTVENYTASLLNYNTGFIQELEQTKQDSKQIMDFSIQEQKELEEVSGSVDKIKEIAIGNTEKLKGIIESLNSLSDISKHIESETGFFR